MPSNTNMENKDACNDLQPFVMAKKPDIVIDIELRGPAGLVYAHSEVEHPASLECAIELNMTGNTETRRGSALQATKVIFCFAAAVVMMIVFGLPLVVLSFYGTKQLEVLVLGEGTGLDVAHNSAIASGEMLPVKLERRDGTDSQSSNGGLMGVLTGEF